VCIEQRIKYNGVPVVRNQLPLNVAAAGTVHAAQGVTCDVHVMYPPDVSGGFARSLLYVALSRVKRLTGLVLLSMVNAKMFTKFRGQAIDIDSEYAGRRRRAEASL
jgi:ATP-dependent exoDNAse (exonuclease V) alpha subunit